MKLQKFVKTKKSPILKEQLFKVFDLQKKHQERIWLNQKNH